MSHQVCNFIYQGKKVALSNISKDSTRVGGRRGSSQAGKKAPFAFPPTITKAS